MRAATIVHRFADQALPDRRVLRVDRAQPGERARVRVARVRRRARRGERTGQRHDEVTAGDQRLLVGRGDDLAGPQRGEDRAKADDARRCRRPRDRRRRRVARASRASGPPTRSVPIGRSRPARASASSRATAAGRSRAACSASSVPLEPAASATTRNASGCPARTSTAWRPIDPVEPIRATRRGSVAGPSRPSAEDGDDIQRDDRGGEQERIDAIEHPAVARDQRAGVLGAGRPLEDGLGEVAGLRGEAR